MSHSSRGRQPMVSLIARRAWLAANMAGLGLTLLRDDVSWAGDRPVGPPEPDPELLKARKREFIRRMLDPPPPAYAPAAGEF